MSPGPRALLEYFSPKTRALSGEALPGKRSARSPGPCRGFPRRRQAGSGRGGCGFSPVRAGGLAAG